MGGERVALFLQIGQLLLETVEPFLGGLVLLFLQRLALDLELHDAPRELVQLRGHRVDFHAQLGRGFVHQIDGLVREEPIRDVAVREDGGGDERRILDLHPVVDLVALAEAAQDADRVLDGRLADHHRLEPAFERGILLDVLAVLVERGGANRVELAAREHRLEHVRRVNRALGRARPDDGVQLVDEQDDEALRVGDFLEDRLQALFELPAIFRARDERAHVERDDALLLQPFGHVAADDAAGQAFDDGRLADAGFADEDRIVLRPARQHLNDAPDLLVAADDRIQLAAAGELGQVATVPLERLVGAFGVLIGHALRAAHARQRLEDPVAGDAVLRQHLGGRGASRFPRRWR